MNRVGRKDPPRSTPATEPAEARGRRTSAGLGPATVVAATVDPATVDPATVDPATVDPATVVAAGAALGRGRRTRAGLDPATVVAAGAALADEVGFAGLTMGLLAERLGVRTPSLYKHIASQDDLNRRIAALALTEAADAVDAAVRGHAGRDALGAAARAFRDFVLTHPGRYAASIGVEPTGPGDPIAVAGLRLLRSFTAVLRAYAIGPDDMDHALRALRSFLHGFATLQAAHGFQWSADVDESFEWLIALVDSGLRHPPTA